MFVQYYKTKKQRYIEAVVQKSSVKSVFKNFADSQENTCNSDTNVSCEFSGIFKKTFL